MILQQQIAIHERIETDIRLVIDKIETVFNAYQSVLASYTTIVNQVMEYKTIFTTILATYKTRREGYQQEYENKKCETTSTITITGSGPSKFIFKK